MVNRKQRGGFKWPWSSRTDGTDGTATPEATSTTSAPSLWESFSSLFRPNDNSSVISTSTTSLPNTTDKNTTDKNTTASNTATSGGKKHKKSVKKSKGKKHQKSAKH
jgi:hypothetical protein